MQSLNQDQVNLVTGGADYAFVTYESTGLWDAVSGALRSFTYLVSATGSTTLTVRGSSGKRG
jgi:hypothetical protein